MHELEHYGFIVEVRGAHLGVTGTGKAAHYRLTDSPHAGTRPTYDFQNWDGVLYDPKKQNPVRKIRTPRPKKPDIQPIESASNGNKRPTEPAIRNVEGCPNKSAITSLTTPSGVAAPIPPDPVLPLSSKPKLVWSRLRSPGSIHRGAAAEVRGRDAVGEFVSGKASPEAVGTLPDR